MDDELFSNSTQFLQVVIAMKELPPFFRSMAHHAADFWSMDDLQRRVDASVPWDGPLPEPPEAEEYVSAPSKPNLRIVQ
jgi:hypothetical protein